MSCPNKALLVISAVIVVVILGTSFFYSQGPDGFTGYISSHELESNTSISTITISILVLAIIITFVAILCHPKKPVSKKQK